MQKASREGEKGRNKGNFARVLVQDRGNRENSRVFGLKAGKFELWGRLTEQSGKQKDTVHAGAQEVLHDHPL